MELKPHDIIAAIEAYRYAFIATRNADLLSEKRKYKPLVSQDNMVTPQSGPAYFVSLQDSWIGFNQPGSICLHRETVENSHFQGKTLVSALEKLLDFTRLQFLDDVLFDKI